MKHENQKPQNKILKKYLNYAKWLTPLLGDKYT